MPPVTDSHRAQAATDHNVNFRTNRRKEMKDTNVLSDTNKNDFFDVVEGE